MYKIKDKLMIFKSDTYFGHEWITKLWYFPINENIDNEHEATKEKCHDAEGLI